MNKKLYNFISKKDYDKICRIREIFIKMEKEVPTKYNVVYKQAADGTYYRPKNLSYETVIEILIRENYSINQEFAILRQQKTKPEEFQQYFDFVESCKKQAKAFIEERSNWNEV